MKGARQKDNKLYTRLIQMSSGFGSCVELSIKGRVKD